MSDQDDRAALIQLHHRFVELISRQPHCCRALIDDVLLQPVSTAKLRAAAWMAIRRSACPFELSSDVMQEAIVAVLQSFHDRMPPYTDRGAEAFGRWLWRLWYRASRRAIGRLHYDQRRCVDARVSEFVDVTTEAARASTASRDAAGWEQIHFHISRIDDQQLRLVLSDWAFGFTAAESSRMRGIPQWTVSRLRKQGVNYLRRKVNLDRSETD